MNQAQMEHDLLDVLQILEQAVSVTAEDIRFTAYRPANEVGIRFKLHTGNGSQKFVPGPIESYNGGARLVRVLLRDLCGVKDEIYLEKDAILGVELLPEWAQRLGVLSARVVNSPIRSADSDGFICVLTLTYSVGSAHALVTSQPQVASG